MTDDRRRSARRVFMEVADLAGNERDAALDEACGDDAALRAEVETLLRAEAQAGAVLANPTGERTVEDVASAATVVSIPTEKQDDQIGRYKLLEPIGEGGFGVVWAAEQREPVRRRVALKIIKLGMDTKQVIARFEAERQALAMMDHPNIAKVFDAGATETGRPYFVMELVKGVSILDYCDTEKLNTKARLDLFMKVCHAIQHAHQKGIIHRDIKPGNVLVTMLDGTPVPKVIDFGIAKATNQELTEKTIYTQHRQMIGTPAYMSPEQAEMTGLDIDTRSDVYSLGVLLYELLTGTTPFDSQSLLEAGLAEMMRIIREETPHKPSTRLSSLDALPSIAAQRQIEPKRLGLLIRGDLDWIVMKAMEKNRDRRYETARGLAMDIERHLTNEPVIAGPPGAPYRIGKFVRRHRGPVIAALSIGFAVMIGVIGTVTFAAREAHQRQLASRGESEARQIAGFQSSVLADANMDDMGQAILAAFREQVRVRLERQWLTDAGGVPRPRTDAEIADVLAQLDAIARPSDAAEIARDMIDIGILVPAIESINDEFADQPLLQSELLLSIGITYDGIGRFHAAEAVDRRALELLRDNDADSDLIAGALYHFANDLISLGRNAEAIPIVREGLELNRALYGNTHIKVADAIDQLGTLLANTGDHAEAERLGQEHLAMTIELEGKGGWPQIGSLWSLGYLAHLRDDLDEAESIYREALAIADALGDGDSRSALTLKYNIAQVMVVQGRLADAEVLHREVLAARRAMLGHRHPGIAYSLDGLAHTLLAKGDFAGAEPLALEALAIRRESIGAEDPRIADSLTTLSQILVAKRDFIGAEPVYRELLSHARLRNGGEHIEVHAAMMDLSEIWILLDRDDDGEKLLTTCGETLPRIVPSDDWNLARLSSLRGWLLARQLKFEAAEPLLISGYEGIPPHEEAYGETDEKRKALQRIIDCYDAWHDKMPGGGYNAKADLWRSRQVHARNF